MFGLFEKLLGSQTEKTQEKIHRAVKEIEREQIAKQGSRFNFKEVYKEATEDKIPVQMMILAQIYYYGDGDIQIDYEKAHYWYVQAAEAGHLPSMVNVGVHYQKGLCGCEINHEQAKYWFNLAKNGGYNLSPDILLYLEE